MKLPDSARAAVEKEIEAHRKSITELESFLKANGINAMTEEQKKAHSAKIKAGMKKKKAEAAKVATGTSPEVGQSEAQGINGPASGSGSGIPTPAASSAAPKAVPGKPLATTTKLPGVPMKPSAAVPEVVGAASE